VIAYLPWFPLAGVVWAGAYLAIRLAAQPGDSDSLLLGWAVAGGSGLLSFGLMAYANGRPLTVLLKAVLGGFFARMLLVVVGVLAALRLGHGPVGFCLSFFTLYLIFFGIEFLALQQGLRRHLAPARVTT
jgi:hypothetical protein